jgi:hypothetical protein
MSCFSKGAVTKCLSMEDDAENTSDKHFPKNAPMTAFSTFMQDKDWSDSVVVQETVALPDGVPAGKLCFGNVQMRYYYEICSWLCLMH